MRKSRAGAGSSPTRSTPESISSTTAFWRTFPPTGSGTSAGTSFPVCWSRNGGCTAIRPRATGGIWVPARVIGRSLRMHWRDGSLWSSPIPRCSPAFTPRASCPRMPSFFPPAGSGRGSHWKKTVSSAPMPFWSRGQRSAPALSSAVRYCWGRLWAGTAR